MKALFLHKKVITPFIAFVLALVFVAGVALASVYMLRENPQTASMQTLYEAAVRDAVFADEDEIQPLVNLEAKDDRVTWNQAGDKILLLTWHKYPDSYPSGTDVSLKWGEVWTFTDREVVNRYKGEAKTVTDWTLRLKQLIGLPPDSAYTHMTAFWVDPKDVIRPAYTLDPTSQMTNAFDAAKKEMLLEWYQDWFNGNIIWSYFDSAYPWTRLGYTYDWADNGQEYGLSEFLVLPDSKVTVEFTLSTEEFVLWMEQQGK